jgi:bone morphogenetic protein receptor type-2
LSACNSVSNHSIFLGCDERLNSDGKLEYLLVLSLAELGSLQEYLRNNASTFQIFSRMAMSIARGLSHLHTRIQKANMIKMCICHRDLNSRNILVKADLSCCLCDFGFGTKLNGSRYEYQGEMILAETKSIYEVGTLRYMAPEILEGAVNLRDCETSLKQIDVYSLGLVLWELCMRCHEFYSPEMPTPQYKAPYEAEIGVHPTFDQMRALVLQHKARPLFPPQWGGGTAAIAAKEVCEDCWDPDAEARLTSLCVEERLIEIATLKPRSHYVTLSTPLSTNNNLVTSPAREHHSMMIPPNQIVVHNEDTMSSPSAEYGVQKNREMYAQQIQPFQGRNLCLERNLVQVHQADQSSDEKSIKKCPLSNGNQLLNTAPNENFHAEYEVLVEELLSRKLASTSSSTAVSTTREILPKKNNSEKKSSRWRDIIHSKFQMKRKHQSLNVDSVSQSFSSPVHKSHKHMDAIVESKPNNIQERPRNLDIASPIIMNNSSSSYKSPLNNPNNDSFAIVHEPNNKIVTSKSATLSSAVECNENSVLKRQRSLEVFREVFGPSKMNLSNVQCRVKTPGDLPASVRKVRASKTLSLYDDRMMTDPTEKFIKDNNSL